MFKKCGLETVVDTNLKTVDSLDVTFGLHKNIYKPYRKPTDSLIYINKNSNHPRNISKQLPKSITKRTSETSSSMEIFNKSIKIYSKALKESGCTNEIKFLPMKYSNLKLTKEGNAKEKNKNYFVQPTLFKKRKNQCG